MKKTCPFCGSVTFYKPIDHLVSFYFYITENGVVPTQRSAGFDITGLVIERFKCVGCAWEGGIRDVD